MPQNTEKLDLAHHAKWPSAEPRRDQRQRLLAKLAAEKYWSTIMNECANRLRAPLTLSFLEGNWRAWYIHAWPDGDASGSSVPFCKAWITGGMSLWRPSGAWPADQCIGVWVLSNRTAYTHQREHTYAGDSISGANSAAETSGIGSTMLIHTARRKLGYDPRRCGMEAMCPADGSQTHSMSARSAPTTGWGGTIACIATL